MKLKPNHLSSCLKVIAKICLLLLIYSCGKSIEDTEKVVAPKQQNEEVKTGSDNENIKAQKLLYDAILSNDLQIIDQAILENKNLNFEFDNGHTPLTLSILLADNIITNKIIESGADIELSNKSGQTPLLVAIFKQDYFLVKTLLERKVNPNMHHSEQLSPLEYAINKSEQEIAVELILYGAHISKGSELYVLSKQKNLKVIIELVDAIDNRKEDKEQTHLNIIKKSSINLIKYKMLNSSSFRKFALKENTFTRIIEDKDKTRSKEILNTIFQISDKVPSHLSAMLFISSIKADNDEVYSLLVDYNLSPLLANVNGETPLDYAASKLNIKFVKKLKESITTLLEDSGKSFELTEVLKESCAAIPEHEEGVSRTLFDRIRGINRISYEKKQVQDLLTCFN